MPSPISISELADSLSSENEKLIDVRQVDAWNGWSLKGESHGGHITGATSIPLRWLRELGAATSLSELPAADITPTNELIVYGHGRDDAGEAAARLEALGFDAVRVFENGLPVWADDPDRPTVDSTGSTSLSPGRGSTNSWPESHPSVTTATATFSRM